MPNVEKKVSYPELNGAEQHHELKNQPGEKGDADHADEKGQLDAENEKAIKASSADTQIADALRDAAK